MNRVKYVLINDDRSWLGLDKNNIKRMISGSIYTLVFYGEGIYVYDSEDKNYLGYIEKSELCHFMTLAELREQQIKSVLE